MPIDWTHLVKSYRGKWVALADDETTVLASADTAKDALKKAASCSQSPLLYRVPDTLDTFVGYEILI